MNLSERLAGNVRFLRGERGLTQAQLAKIAGIPRATWALVEAGANPTLQVLSSVADALQVSLEELLSAPRSEAVLYREADLHQKKRGEITMTRVIPEPLAGIELDKFLLPPQSRMTGVPHKPGTREYLVCERGALELSVSGERIELREGDVAVFRGDQKHGYSNPHRERAVAYSMVVFARE